MIAYLKRGNTYTCVPCLVEDVDKIVPDISAGAWVEIDILRTTTCNYIDCLFEILCIIRL